MKFVTPLRLLFWFIATVLCVTPVAAQTGVSPAGLAQTSAPNGLPLAAKPAISKDAQIPKPHLPDAPKPEEANSGPSSSKPEAPQPFGSKLFMGNFLSAREDGLNPDYVIMPGDRVNVNTWGAVELSEVLVVDGQGNIFLPSVGPIHLAGTANRDLTDKVKAGFHRVYARHFNVYTNLLTAKPVAVFVTGGVERPGRYAGVPSDSVLFFLDQAGGIDQNLGSYRKISVLRNGASVAEIDLYEFLLKGQLPDVQFEDGDTVLVHQRGAVIELDGNVAMPALLEFPKEDVTGSDALSVIPGAARATQVTIRGVRDGTPISRTLDVPGFKSFGLKDGDSITLRDDGRSDTILIHLEGEYQGPSVLAVQRGSRLVDVLNYVPIDPTLANSGAVHLRRSSVARVQKDSIDDALFRLERSALLALSDSQGEAAIRVREAELTMKFVERARTIQPLGRVVTARERKQRNIVLEEGDVVVIPARTNVVRVGGEVMMSQAVMYRPGATAEDYIADAGGYTDRSDSDKVIVIHPNAEVAIGDTDIPILPGDEILVPPDVDSKVIQNTVDITQIIYQIAVSAAVVVAIL